MFGSHTFIQPSEIFAVAHPWRRLGHLPLGHPMIHLDAEQVFRLKPEASRRRSTESLRPLPESGQQGRVRTRLPAMPGSILLLLLVRRGLFGRSLFRRSLFSRRFFGDLL